MRINIIVALCMISISACSSSKPHRDPDGQYIGLAGFPTVVYSASQMQAAGMDRAAVKAAVTEGRRVWIKTKDCLGKVYKVERQVSLLHTLELRPDWWVSSDGIRRLAKAQAGAHQGQWCPTKPESLFWLAGEIHSVWRYYIFGPQAVYDQRIPTRQIAAEAQLRCVDVWEVSDGNP